jgi:hypothetical protein
MTAQTPLFLLLLPVSPVAIGKLHKVTVTVDGGMVDFVVNASDARSKPMEQMKM